MDFIRHSSDLIWGKAFLKPYIYLYHTLIIFMNFICIYIIIEDINNR